MLNMNAYPVKRAQQQVQAGALKSKKLEVGVKIKFEELIEDEFETTNGKKVVNDKFLCVTSTDKRLTVPVREYLKMNLVDGNKHYKTEPGSENVTFPSAIIIRDSKDRLDKKGNPIFPVFAYKEADTFLAVGSSMTWNELVEHGLKDEHPFDVVQDYTIEVLY